MAASLRINIGCDTDVQLYRVRARGQYLNDATVTWELTDSNGSTVDSGTCDYQTGSNGTYLGTIESDTTSGLTLNTLYTLTVTLSASGINDYREVECVAKYRGQN